MPDPVGFDASAAWRTARGILFRWPRHPQDVRIRPSSETRAPQLNLYRKPVEWVGKWRNQYGSILEITEDADNRIAGAFQTALEDSGFFGQSIGIAGVHYGDCVSLAVGGRAAAGNMVVTHTGLFREGRPETVWSVVADAVLSAPAAGAPAEVKPLNWWRAVTTNADSFVRL
jgi:hypothetical protein